MAGKNTDKEPVCGFCGATPSTRKNVPFIPSECFDGLAICGECLKRGNLALERFAAGGAEEKKSPVAGLRVPRPSVIKSEVD